MANRLFQFFCGRGDKAQRQARQMRAEKGDADSQFSIAFEFANAKGEKQDYQQAAEWYLKAASQNHPLAQYNLAMMYTFGQGVARDDSRAFLWLSRAAEQGDPGAQYHLGLRHRRAGLDGLPAESMESRIEAYKWFRLASAQGYFGSESASELVAVKMTMADVREGDHRAASFVISSPIPTLP